MRIGFHLEDESDKVLLKAFINRITSQAVNEAPTVLPEEDDVRTGRRRFTGGPLRFTGDTYVLDHIRSACRDFHARFFRGVVIGVDNDESIPRHEGGHDDDITGFADSGCRVCKIRRNVPAPFSERTDLVDPFIAIVSVPVEMIESWVLFGRGFNDPESIPKNELKIRLYGTSSPSRVEIQDTCVPIIESIDVTALEGVSPSFAIFVEQVRFFVGAHEEHLQEAPW